MYQVAQSSQVLSVQHSQGSMGPRWPSSEQDVGLLGQSFSDSLAGPALWRWQAVVRGALELGFSPAMLR